MKITAVEALYLRLPEIRARTDSSQDALIVKVSTDAGITGWGEVDGCPAVTKAVIEAPMSHTLVTGLRELLIGEDPLETLRLWRKMYQGTLYYGREGAVIQAMAGIDLALWDIKGKALQQPVYKLLGGGFRKKLRVYASNMFQFSAAATAERARKAKDEGFTAVKFGWEPFGKDERTDCAYLDAIRAAIGDEIDIMLDVGLIWDAKTTLQRARLFEPYRLAWIEEPLHPDDLAGYAKVARRHRHQDRGRRGGVHGRGLHPPDGRGPDRRRPGRSHALRPDPGAGDRQARRAARPARDQPQLHDRHQRRGVLALPRERAERLHHGILRRAFGDQPGARQEPDPDRRRPRRRARGARPRHRAQPGDSREVSRALRAENDLVR